MRLFPIRFSLNILMAFVPFNIYIYVCVCYTYTQYNPNKSSAIYNKVENIKICNNSIKTWITYSVKTKQDVPLKKTLFSVNTFEKSKHIAMELYVDGPCFTRYVMI